MRSPFPGMDPYLEHHWRDVHHRLITYACDQLQPELPRGLRARMEERVFLESDLGLHLDSEPATQGYLEIIDVGSGNRVVTVIEFLSPSNKFPGEGLELYLQKQREVVAAGASLVEIDLTRAGRRVLSIPPERVPPPCRTTYQASVRRGWKPSQVEVYRLPLARPLATIRVPLRETDADVPLDLQGLIDLCYANGRYDDLDYRGTLDPPLDPPDAAWADELLRAKGLR